MNELQRIMTDPVIRFAIVVTLISLVGIGVAVLFRKNSRIQKCVLRTALVLVVVAPFLVIGFQAIDYELHIAKIKNEKTAEYESSVPESVDINFENEARPQANIFASPGESPTNLANEASVKSNTGHNTSDSSSSSNSVDNSGYSFRAYAFGVWIAGFGISLAIVLVSAFNLVQLLRNSTPICNSRLKEIAKTVQASSAIQSLNVLVSDRLPAPVAIGVGQWNSVVIPRYLIPAITPVQFEQIIRHETEHIANRDTLFLLISRIGRAIWWWHPLVLLAERMLDRAREEVCDEAVLESFSPVEYGKTLLAISRLAIDWRRPTILVSLLGAQWKLEDRIKNMLKPGRKKMARPNKISVLMVAVGFAALAVVASAAQIGDQDKLPQKENAVVTVNAQREAESKRERRTKNVGNQTRERSSGAGIAQKVGTFQFSGNFPKLPDASFRISLDYGPSNRLEGATVANGKTDSKGQFSTKIGISEGQAFALMIEKRLYRLWAAPRADLAISENGKAEFTCSGSLAVQNQLLFDSQLAGPMVPISNEKFNPLECLKSVDAIQDSQLRMLEKFRKKIGKESDRFCTYAHAEIIGAAAHDKNTPSKLAIARKKLSKTDLPKNFYDFWNSFPVLDDSAAMLSRTYQNALRAKFDHIAEQELIAEGHIPAEDPGRWGQRDLEVQGQHLVNHPNTDELMYASRIMFMIKYMPAKDTMRTIKHFSTKFSNSNYQTTIENAFAKTQSIDLAAIDEACELRDINGTPVKFSEMKGKVIYVEFWGLWCKAYESHQPNLEKLIERFSDNDEVVFLSLNFYDEQNDWKAFVDGNKPKGLHWKPVAGEEEKMGELFVLNDSFPRYMIFGKKGELISASAPIPRHKGLPEMLENATR